MKEKQEIQLMNKIIEQAVIHGGDDGGAYFCNPNGIEKAIKNWLKFKGLDKEYIVIMTEISYYDNEKFEFNIIPKIEKNPLLDF